VALVRSHSVGVSVEQGDAEQGVCIGFRLGEGFLGESRLGLTEQEVTVELVSVSGAFPTSSSQVDFKFTKHSWLLVVSNDQSVRENCLN